MQKIFYILFKAELPAPILLIPISKKIIWALLALLGLVFGMPNFLTAGLGISGLLPALPILTILFPLGLCVLSLSADTRLNAFRWAYLLSVPTFAIALYWLGYPLHNQGGLPIIAVIPFLLLVGSYLALYPALFALFFRIASAKLGLTLSSLLLPLLAAFLWFVQESLCGVVFTGFPWLNLSMAFVPWSLCIQLVSVLGSYGLAAFLAAIACLLGQLHFLFWNSKVDASKFNFKLNSCIFLLLSVWLGFGYLELKNTHSLPEMFSILAPKKSVVLESSGSNVLDVALIQGNINQDQKWDRKYHAHAMKTYQSLSLKALAANNAKNSKIQDSNSQNPDLKNPNLKNPQNPQNPQNSPNPQNPILLIWPETAMPFDCVDESLAYQELKSFVAENNFFLIFGSILYNRQANGEMEPENQANFILPSGVRKGSYSKEHLVPFGEYVPLSLDKLPLVKDVFAGILQGVGTFKKGKAGQSFGRVELEGANLDIGMLICYESIFPEIAQKKAQNANLLVNISNDTWFGLSAAPLQHLYLSALRSVEQGRYLLRSTNSGISAVINEQGQIVKHGSIFEPDVIQANVVLLNTKTTYSSLLDFFTFF